LSLIEKKELLADSSWKSFL